MLKETNQPKARKQVIPVFWITVQEKCAWGKSRKGESKLCRETIRGNQKKDQR